MENNSGKKLLQIRVDEEFLELLDRKAKLSGLDRTGYVKLLVTMVDVSVSLKRSVDTPQYTGVSEEVSENFFSAKTSSEKKPLGYLAGKPKEVVLEELRKATGIAETPVRETTRQKFIRSIVEGGESKYAKARALYAYDAEKAKSLTLELARKNDIPEEYISLADMVYQDVIINGFMKEL